ncbi:MAG: Mur ligase family protein [bacterium]|nr:Mur ligase family protein [bacterium]
MKTSLFLGVGGSGMRGLAYLLRQQGEQISGFDDAPGASEISLEEAQKELPRADRLVYSDAAQENHPLRIEAKRAGIREVPYQKALGEFSCDYQTIAITGTHGKSSTTAFLAHICIEAMLDPVVLVGANMESLRGKHAQFGQGKYFIVEADEYRNHFLELFPAHSIITTIDFDHPDSFSSLQDTEKAYQKFISHLAPDGLLVIPEHEKMRHPSIVFPQQTTTVSDKDIIDIQTSLPGKHMRMNGALAVKLAEKIGIPRANAIASLKTFPGLSRRFELLGTYNGCDIRSDYGHHPAEISTTIEGAREVYPTARIVAVFEAHMPLRLRTFYSDFVNALSLADEIVIVPPFAPTGRDDNGVDDAIQLKNDLLRAGKPAQYTEDSTEFLHHLQSDSIALLFSAGALDATVRNFVKKG